MTGLPSHSGDGEIRTLDPLLARQVLSQLSYTPTDAGLPSFEAIPFLILFFRLSQADGLKWTRTTDLTLFLRFRQPPALPCRLQHSTIGR